ncbi:MAG: hypothetical protein ACM30E_08565 [Nitrososphaerales archaeon]
MFGFYGQIPVGPGAYSGIPPRYDAGVEAIGKAVSVFHSLYWRARVKAVWGKLTRRPHGLLDLDDVRRKRTIEAMHETGCVTIEVKKIRGSECRVCDFDDEFLPLRESTAERWAGIYAARLVGQALPAVSLVQIGDTYYVRDGHHRVSVARLLGEEYIEAHVQVWQVKGEPAQAPAMAAQQLLAIF